MDLSCYIEHCSAAGFGLFAVIVHERLPVELDFHSAVDNEVSPSMLFAAIPTDWHKQQQQREWKNCLDVEGESSSLKFVDLDCFGVQAAGQKSEQFAW